MRLSSGHLRNNFLYSHLKSHPYVTCLSGLLPINQYSISSYINRDTHTKESFKRASGQKNLHKKTFIFANINWCRRRRDARNLTFLSSYLTRLNKDEAKVKVEPLLDITSLLLLLMRRDWRTKGEKKLRHWNPKFSSPVISFVSAKHINCHACLRGWNNRLEASRRTRAFRLPRTSNANEPRT